MNKKQFLDSQLLTAKIMVSLGGTLIAVFILVDYLVYTDFFISFLTIRLTIIATFAAALIHLFFVKNPNIRFWIITCSLAVSIGLALMAGICGEGYNSQYYNGVLQVLAALVLMPFTTRFIGTLMGVNILSYLLVIYFGDMDSVHLNKAFIVATRMCSVYVLLLVAHFYINRLKKNMEAINDKNIYFVKAFAHDIKNRLTLSMMSLQLAESENKDIQNIVNQPLNDCRHMNRSVGNLINVFSEDNIVLKKKPVDIEEIAAEFKKEWSGKFEKNSISFNIESSAKGSIDIDADYMELVWDNLFANAIQHTPDGGKVVIKIYKEGCFFSLSFCNSGDVVPEESREKIFEKFNNPKDHSAYSKGLGINYSKMMVERHGGSFTYRVCDEGLNEFNIKLPVS